MSGIDRRTALAAGLASLIAAPALARTKPFVPMAGPRHRVLFANDFSGDIDGFFAGVHAILSTSIDLRGLIGTYAMNKKKTAARAAELCQEMLVLMGRKGGVPVHAGAETKLAKAGEPIASPGAQAIIDEARRSDTALPLFVLVGGGLTEVASALMLAPDIASKFTLVWNGGDGYPEGGTGETNFMTDPLAAQYIYSETELRIWQVTRKAFGKTMVSASEIQAYVAPHGAIGKWLYQQLVDQPLAYGGKLNMGATWSLGDSPLVLLTALNNWTPSEWRPALKFEQTDSSDYVEVFAPHFNADGSYALRTEGRKIRIYNDVDVRMMMGDFFAKLKVAFPAK